MRKIYLALFAAGLATSAPIEAPAAPATPLSSAAIVEAARANPPVEPARLFCYNRYTGRFLHWGSCGRRHWVRHYYHPRVYCYNRRTGRFLHWGHC